MNIQQIKKRIHNVQGQNEYANMNTLQKLSIFVLASFLVTGCSSSPPPKKMSVETSLATTAKIPGNLKLTGTLQAVNEVDVSAKAAGRVTGINVNIGDRINSGSVILTLDGTTERATVQSLQNNKAIASQGVAAVENLYNEHIQGAQKQLETAKNSSASAIALIKKQLEEAEKNTLTSTTLVGDASVDTVNTQLKTAKKDLLTNSSNALANADIILSQVNDKLLEVYFPPNNTYGVYEYTTRAAAFFQHVSSEYVPPAQNAIAKLREDYKSFHTYYTEHLLNKTPTSDEIDSGLTKVLLPLQDAQLALNATHDILTHTFPTSEFTVDEVAGYKMILSNYVAQLETIIHSVHQLYGTDGVASQIAILEKQATLAQAQAAASKNGIASQIAVLKEQLSKAEIDVAGQTQQIESTLEALFKEKEAKLIEANAQVAQLNGQENVNQTLVNNGVVTAPFGGVVTAKQVEIGAVVGPGIPLFHLADDSILKLNIGVPDSSISAFIVGREAEISVDALTDKKFKAKITKIYPAVDPVSKKVTIELSLKNSDHILKVGDFARVEFSLAQENGVVVPISAVVSRYGVNFVYVVNNGKVTSKNVVTSNRSDDLIAISSGINEGETVVTKGAAFLRDGDEVTFSTQDSTLPH